MKPHKCLLLLDTHIDIMAGHSQFKNIMHRKGAQDAKKARLFTKLIREILVATKTGGSDPDSNPRLRTALAAARNANVSKDKITNAINKASSSDESKNLKEMVYECYLSGGIALIIEAVTDNTNRTASELRSILNKHNGRLASSGEVLYLFNKLGLIEFINDQISPDIFLEAVIDAGGEEYQLLPNGKYQIFCNHVQLHDVQTILAKKLGEPETIKLIWHPKTSIEVSDHDLMGSIINTVIALEDQDDVQHIYGNYTNACSKQ